MSKPVVKVVIAAVVTFALAMMGIYGLSSPGSTSEAQDRAADLRELLQQLVDDDIPFFIVFTTPVHGAEDSWYIPGEIKDDEGNIIGRLFVREIGIDYICVDEIGQGATTVICVPFTNVAYVTYTS